jgi:glutamyl-tRNA reductase
MTLLLLGVNHRTAGLDNRESLAFGPEEAGALLSALGTGGAIREAAVLSTCNRTEFYVAATEVTAADRQLQAVVREVRPNDPLAPGDHRYVRTGPDAVSHLLRVGCGLDSMVVGDVQILGQVKEAYQIARQAGTSGPFLDRLFQTALHAGKRARTETSIGVGTVSVSSAVVEMAAHRDVARTHGHETCPRHEHGLTGKHLVVIGAGDAARLAALHARQHQPASITIVNRTRPRGDALAAEIGGTACLLDELPRLLRTADVIFSATRATAPVLTAVMLQHAMPERGGRPLVVFDMAVPRDVEPAAGDLQGVHLHAIDVIQSVVDAHMTERNAQVPEVERIIADETERFETWQRGLSATPTVVALRDHFERIRLEELDRQLANASEDERSRADRLTRALVNRLLHTPTVRLKDADPTSDDGRTRLQAMRDLFALGLPSEPSRGQDA